MKYICSYAGFNCVIEVNNESDICVKKLQKEFGFYYDISIYNGQDAYDVEIVIGNQNRREVAHKDKVCIHSSHSRNRKYLLDGSTYTQQDASMYAYKEVTQDGMLYYICGENTYIEVDLNCKKVYIDGENIYKNLVYVYESLLNIFIESVGGILFHAASCSLDGKGYIICGKSGAGKTTLLFDMIKKGAKFYSNDRLAVFIDKNRVYSYGIPIPVNVPIKTMKQIDEWKNTNIVKTAENDSKIRFNINELEKLFGNNIGKLMEVNYILSADYNESESNVEKINATEIEKHVELLTPYDECHPKWIPMFQCPSSLQVKENVKKIGLNVEIYKVSGISLINAFNKFFKR